MKQLNVQSVSCHLLIGSSCRAGVSKLCLAQAGVPDGKGAGIVIEERPASSSSFFHVASADCSIVSVATANNRHWKQHRRAGAHAAFTSRGESAELQEEEDSCGR